METGQKELLKDCVDILSFLLIEAFRHENGKESTNHFYRVVCSELMDYVTAVESLGDMEVMNTTVNTMLDNLTESNEFICWLEKGYQEHHERKGEQGKIKFFTEVISKVKEYRNKWG